MFCQKCGKSLADDAKVCDGCGAEVVVQQETVKYVQVPAAPNPTIVNFVAAIKNFWANPVVTVSNAAKSVTHEWALFAGIGIIVYALASAVVGLELFSQLMNSVVGTLGNMLNLGSLYPFFAIFGIGVLVAAATFFGVSFGIWLLVVAIFKKKATFVQVMNMVAVASLPLIVIHLVNMLVGLLFAAATFVLFLTVLMMTVICLYIGMQKFDKLEKSPFYGFAVVMLAVAIIANLLGLLYASVFANHLMSVVGNTVGDLIGSNLGGMSSLF